jgi:hypothetical protein
MTPAKAVPMREDITLIVVQDDKGFITLHEPNEDGEPGDLVASVWRDDWLDRLAHTARPDAVSMDAKADNMEARPDAGDEDVERVARAIYDATHVGLRNCYSWDDYWEDHQEAGRERYYKEARAALAAMREGVDRGMVEVPREPTDAAIFFVSLALSKAGNGQTTYSMAQSWRVGGSEQEAIDAAVLFAAREKPGFGVWETLVARVPVAAALSPEQPR